MIDRAAFLFATTAAALALTAPARAHEPTDVSAHTPDAHASGGEYDGEWRGDWHGSDTFHGTWEGTYAPGAMDADHHAARRDIPAAPGGRLGYTMAEREAWLADCRALYAGPADYAYAETRQGNEAGGGVIGGLLGAVVGGIAGNRVADGERLAGTLIGAGIGGLAGLAIGTAIDAAGRRRDDRMSYDDAAYEEAIRAANYCEAYLRRYESGAQSYGYARAIEAGPVLRMGAVQHSAAHRHGPQCREVIREEWVDVPNAPVRPASRAIPPRRAAPEPQPGKLLPVK